MNITIICPQCGSHCSGDPSLLGQVITCPMCQKQFQAGNVAPPPLPVRPTVVYGAYQLAPPPQPVSEIGQAQFVAEPPPSVCDYANTLPYISPAQLQVQGETLVLFGTLSVALALFVFVSMSTAFLFLILFLLAYLQVSAHEKHLQSSGTRITGSNRPELDELLQTAARRLTVPAPNLYVIEKQELGAFALGFDGPGTVKLHSSMLEVMTSDEILFVLGHELTHLKCGHCKYLLFTNATVDSTLNKSVSLFVDLVFRFWSRKAELTCDRGGTIACKNPHAAMTALAKLEVLNEAAAVAMVEAAIRGVPGADNLLSTHPQIKNRIAAIWEYSHTPDFMYLSSASN